MSNLEHCLIVRIGSDFIDTRLLENGETWNRYYSKANDRGEIADLAAEFIRKGMSVEVLGIDGGKLKVGAFKRAVKKINAARS